MAGDRVDDRYERADGDRTRSRCRSPNVLRALEAANDRGLVTVALTGRGGNAGTIAAHHIAVAEDRTARVQEVHATVLHVICELVEKELNG